MAVSNESQAMVIAKMERELPENVRVKYISDEGIATSSISLDSEWAKTIVRVTWGNKTETVQNIFQGNWTQCYESKLAAIIDLAHYMEPENQFRIIFSVGSMLYTHYIPSVHLALGLASTCRALSDMVRL
ncbi:hypothetical protein KEM56_006925 [Ascosphaera pollenicola]|nr:hypothetical protein KEM56_006925 [Ascosphaera pollenicola]